MSTDKRDHQEKEDKKSGAVFRFYSALLDAIQWEKISPEGHINLAVDILLATIIIMYFLSSTVTSVSRIIASIFNEGLTDGTSDNIVVLLLIFIGAALACLLIMHFVLRETNAIKKSKSDNKAKDDQA